MPDTLEQPHAPGIFKSEVQLEEVNFTTIAGPVDQQEYLKTKPYLPGWVATAAEKTFAVQDKNGENLFNSFVAIRGFDNQIYTIIPGIKNDNSFTAYRYFSFTDPEATGSFSIDPIETNKAFKLELDPRGGVDSLSVSQMFKESDKQLWPPEAFIQFDSEEKWSHERQILDSNNAMRLDQRITSLLHQHEGIFLGEAHDYANVRQAITYLMPAFKAQGVTTISLEVEQPLLDMALAADSPETFQRRVPMMQREAVESYFHLAHAAHKYGIKVIGHEPEAEGYLDLLRQGHAHFAPGEVEHRLEKIKKDKTGSIEKLAERDAYAADYIEKNRLPGKIIVSGGAGHSVQSGYLPTDDEQKYTGLNRLLHIPAIDFEDGSEGSGIKVRDEGHTYSNLAAGSDYVLILPDNIAQYMLNHVKPGEYQGTSWPPLKPHKNEEVSLLDALESIPPSFPSKINQPLGKGSNLRTGP